MIRSWQRFSEPALGAAPIQPYPVNSAIRWALAVVFVGYLALTGARASHAIEVAALAAMFAALAATEVAFFRFRNRPQQLLRAWAVIMCLDMAILVIATALDSDEHSPIPAMAVATVFSASEMFRPRYVISLAIASAVAFAGEHVAVDLLRGEDTFSAPFIWLILILGVGTFAATRGLADERLRKDLIDAEQREREQSESLRAALEAARVSEARFDAFSEHAPALLLLFDSSGVVTFRSSFLSAGDSGTGNAHGPIPGLTLSESDARQLHDAVMVATEGGSHSVDISAVLPDGGKVRLRGIAFQVDAGAGAILRDVTVELELAAQVSRAQQLDTVGTLAGGVAHDFNNLLTAILGNLYLAKRSLSDGSPALGFIDEARTAGERGADLVRRLLEYGRPSVDHLELIDPGLLVRATVELARPALSPRIDIAVTSCEQGQVLANFNSLQQVLLNLLFNARDAMHGEGEVRIECGRISVPDHLVAEARGGEYWQIAVTDHGTGMSAETSSRIFDPFFTTKGVGAGSGLGLATSLGIVRAHGGAILVETAEGSGSTFRVLLPVPVAVEIGS